MCLLYFYLFTDLFICGCVSFSEPFLLVVTYSIGHVAPPLSLELHERASLCAGPCVTLFLSLIVSLALRVIDGGQVSRNAFLELLRLLLGGNWLCVAGAAVWGFL